MKKIMLFILAGFFTALLISARDIITTDTEQLPQEARNFLTTYFPQEKVSYIRIDDDLLSKNYDVVLENGTEIEFLESGEWKDVDTKMNEMPLAIIPERIQDYIDRYYTGATVREIKRKKRMYEVELSNRLELQFDLNGNFMGVDD